MKKNKKTKIALEIFFFVIATIFLAIFAILYVQPSAFFYPWHDEKSYNMLLNEKDFEEISLTCDNKKLHGWLKYNTYEKNSPLVIMFCGNSQNSSNTCAFFQKNNFYKTFDGYNLMIIDYPGYGLSEGKPSDESMFKSALTVYDYATTLDSVNKDRIVVLGFSIGTGVASYVASQRDVNGLILIAPYDTTLSLYNEALNIFHGPLKILARFQFDSISYAQNINVSPLIIASYDDEVISYKYTLNLINYFKKDIEHKVLLNNVGHNEFFNQEIVKTEISRYLQKRL